MTTEELTETLSTRGITLFLEGGALRFRAPKGALTADLKQHVADHRGEIIDRLRNREAQRAGTPNAKCRCESNEWVDEPPKDGQVRTHCGGCGRFIGNRPENLAQKRDNPLEPGRHP